MKREDYPAQEPLSEAGEAYSNECWTRSAGIAFEEHSFGPDPYQRLAVYRADKPDGTILIAWHGGGWTSGHKEWMGFMAPALNAAGITFVSPGYRLAPQHVFPTGLQDCIAAVKWVHAHAAEFGGNPARIFLSGHSAGGHYSSLLAVRRDWQGATGLPVDVIKGALPISGVYDFTEGNGMSVRPRFLGGTDANDIAASPIKNLVKPLPSFLVAWGTKDFPHLMTQAEIFSEAAKAAGCKLTALPMQDRSHFTAHYAGGEANGPWVPEAIQFLRDH